MPMPAEPVGVGIVVFDLDDTLYLERDYVRSGFSACDVWATTELGLSGLGAACWQRFVDGGRNDTFDRALAELGHAGGPDVVGRLVEVYRAHEPDIDLLPDAAAAIGRLGAEHRLAVVSDGPEASQGAKVRRLGAPLWSGCTVLTATLPPGNGKPSPMAFRMVEERLGASGRRCVYVADNPAKDFGGPASLGWTTVRVRRPGQLHEHVPSGADVDVEICDFDALDDALRHAGI
jgi:putative hydrolase of the HAD superfamily